MIRPNIGILNALLRITMGLTILSWVTARFIRKPYMQNSNICLAMAGAMKVAEGITRYCPVTDAAERFMSRGDDYAYEFDYEDQEETYNPS